MSEEKGLDEIIKYIRNNRGCVISTWQKDMARGTPVYYFANGTTIYIMSEGGGKLPNIRKNPNVTVGIYTSQPLFGAQIFGTASILEQDSPNFVEEVQKSGFLRERQFPGERPPFFLKVIKVEAHKIVYWHTKKGSASKIIWNNTLPAGKEKTIYDQLLFLDSIAAKHFYPENISRKAPLIFVHDAFQGSFCFKYFQEYFAHNGWNSYAINLRRHYVSQFSRRDKLPAGKVTGNEGISDYVEDLNFLASQMEGDPIIIGHGMGGLVALKYAESKKTRGVVLLNSLPPKDVFESLSLGKKLKKETIGKEFSSGNLFTFSVDRKKGEKLLFKNRLADKDEMFECCTQLCEESAKAFYESHLGEIEIDKEKINAPIFVTGAETDQRTGAKINSQIAKKYGASACKLFPKIDHNFMLAKDWVKHAETIEKFISSIK